MISTLIIGPLVAWLVLDPARVVAEALLLSRIRTQAPAMFDGDLAAENIRLALADAVA